MKNRKLFLVLFLLVAVTLLGVGYAELTNNLSVEGSISSNIDNNNLDVHFAHSSSEPAYTSVSNDNVSIGGFEYSPKSVTFDVAGFDTQNQTATVILKVVNSSAKLSEYDAQLGAFTISMTHGAENSPAEGSQTGNVFNGTHYSVTVSYVDGSEDNLTQATGDLNSGSPILEAPTNEFIYVKIVVKVIKPILDNLDSHSFTVSFAATTLSHNE